MGNDNMKLFSGGHVLYFTGGFPPAQGGSCVLNQNLLQGFDTNSYTVVTYNHYVNWIEVEQKIDVYRPVKLFKRLNSVFLPLQKVIVKRKLNLLVKKKKANLIIAAYPDIYFLDLALSVSLKYKIPLVLYLHDTIYEAHKNTKLENFTLSKQKKLFSKANLICVMSTGMQKLYKDKYGLETYPLRHTFNHSTLETTKKNLMTDDVLFWGGAIYGINKVSISKISKILPQSKFSLELATNASRVKLEQFGVNFDKVKMSYYNNITNYWEAIIRSKCLLLALDNQSDTEVDFDEIATIFPTKAIEYMFSEVPILVICPPTYFLNSFFREHDCGVVVDDINDEQAILSALNTIEKYEETVQRKVINAKKVASQLFNPEIVRNSFKSILEENFLSK